MVHDSSADLILGGQIIRNKYHEPFPISCQR